MTYNNQNLPRYVETAGKITILTALSGVLIFAFIFILNIGKTELQKAEAANNGTATTTLTVLNTPPQWNTGFEGQEEFQSSTSTPTNSGNVVSWIGTATDANGSPYFMLICSTAATPTAHNATSSANLGVAPPTCNGGTQWGVSTATLSGLKARVATTTTEAFASSNVWYAWVCDDDPVLPLCNTSPSQGLNATNSSPFVVNHRPVFTGFNNNGPKDPGTLITFNSSSSDPDVNNITLIVCSNNTYSTTTNLCGVANVDFLASTSALMTTNATATKLLNAILQDNTYAAYGYVYDQFGHSATGGSQGTNVTFVVNNVAPTVLGSDITLNGGVDMSLTNPGGQTGPFTLSVLVRDANSCDAFGGPNADEITNLQVSILRYGVGIANCITSGNYNANNCYTSAVATTTWNLSCTASTTSCIAGGNNDSEIFNCTFPLWFIADPTNGTSSQTLRSSENWVAGVAGIDNNNATGSMATSSIGVEVNSLLAINLLSQAIAYDNNAPGSGMANLTASTSLQVLGNTGLNELLGGDSMCINYTPGSPCNASATTSTIPQLNQKFATSSAAYGSATAYALTATSTPTTLLIKIPKPTSTSTLANPNGVTYWGIYVPGAITLSGAYTGQNTFSGAVSAPAVW